MPKRAATNELNHFNWNQEEEPEEESPTPKIASPEVLSKRVIRTAKRISNSTSSAASKSAFSNFPGFGCTPNSSGSDVKSTFSFLSNTNPSIFNNTNGISTLKTEQAGKDDAQVKSNSVKKDNEYLSKLKGLNETVLEWIKIHVGKNPTCILTPIFNDYEKYLKEIQSEKHTKKPEENSVSSSTTNSQSSAPKPFFTNSLFSTTNENKDSTKINSPLSSKETSAPLISGLNPSTNTSNSNKVDNSPSIFSTPVGSSSSSLGEKKPLSSMFGSPFSSGIIGTAQPPINKTEDNENENEEEPPKNVFERVTETDAVFSQRVKLFLKKKDTFVDNGVGTLYIKPVDEEGTKYQAIVRADTSLGNILLNIILQESVPSKRVGKNNVMIVCVLEVDKEMKPVPVLLRVKTEADADNLLEKINKYKK